MKKLSLRFIVYGTMLALAIAASTPSPASPPHALTPTRAPIPRGCTVLTVSKGEQVFFGGNDDYINPDSYYWVDPGTWSDYGAIWIGTPDNVQQGVNEKGLAYDANGLPRVDVNPHSERIPVADDYGSYPIQILHKCATVEEVIAWVKTHRWHSYMQDQEQFADASGDAVIISPGPDGELFFTRKPAGDSLLVSTNFNVANPSHGYGQDSRHPTARRMLGRLLSREGEIGVEDVAGVLDTVHAAGGSSWTIESLVADLPNGVVYLYYFYQFDQPVVLNVAEEIAHPRAPGALSKLFPQDVQQEAARRYQHIRDTDGRWQRLGMAWVALVLVSLILLMAISARQCLGWVFWVPVVAILGPLGLLARLAVWRHRPLDAWRAALLEAAGDVAPTAAAFVALLVALVSVPALLASQPLQVVLILVFPLAVGWLAFQGPLLAVATRKGYLRTLGLRLPQALVSANLGMAGIIAVALPLVNLCLRACSIMPLHVWTAGAWWALAVLGAVAGGLLLFPYELWAARRGFQAWGVLASGEDEVLFPSWRKLWWWILLSFAAVLGGLLASQALHRALFG